ELELDVGWRGRRGWPELRHERERAIHLRVEREFRRPGLARQPGHAGAGAGELDRAFQALDLLRQARLLHPHVLELDTALDRHRPGILGAAVPREVDRGVSRDGAVL